MKAKLKILFEQHSRQWWGYKRVGVQVELLKWDAENHGPDYILDAQAVGVDGYIQKPTRTLLPEDVSDATAIRMAAAEYDRLFDMLPDHLKE